MEDPKTIYSDDEIEKLSEDENDDIALAFQKNKDIESKRKKQKKVQKNKITKKDKNVKEADLNITKEFFSEENFLDKRLANVDRTTVDEDERFAKKKPSSKDEATDIAIVNVRKKMSNENMNLTVKDLEVADDAVDHETETDGVKQPKLNTIKIKVKRKERKIVEKERQSVLEKERYNFEDVAPPEEDVTFLEMNLSSSLLKAISELGYDIPTPIQAATIPVAFKGRDICGCAATGTGKTAAFMLPILQRLTVRSKKTAITRVLVLVPTRELGFQVYEVSKQLAKHTNIEIALSVGGVALVGQQTDLLNNPDIIIATPGRLIDHIYNTENFSLKEIEVLVLDEADRMLDQYFCEQLKEIISQCCITRQTMLFSATMTDEVKDLIAVSLKNPVRIFVNNNTDVAHNLCQEFVRLPIDEKSRTAVLAYLLLNPFKDQQAIVFITTKAGCHDMRITLGLLGLCCGELHSNLSQRDRIDSLDKFKMRKTNILIGTDVAARGLDIKGIDIVINYNVPKNYQTYVHRVGRTARAGYSGRSITLAHDSGDDFKMLKSIKRNSLTPLFERIINLNNIQKYVEKIDTLETAIQDVRDAEHDEKVLYKLQEEVKIVKRKVAALDNDAPPSEPKKLKQWYKESGDQSKIFEKRKEQLKSIIESSTLPRKVKNKPKKEEIDPPKKTFGKQQRKPKQDLNTKENHDLNSDSQTNGNRSSQFVKEFTWTNEKNIKKLRKGPSYTEKKSHFEKKNPGKKYVKNKK